MPTACVQGLFEAQVEKTPNAVAVRLGDECLTYRELNERANQQAHGLIRLGVGPEVLVGIYMERSLELVVGLLSILKAGGAYLPLDPEYPLARLSFMLADAGARFLLTHPPLLQRQPAHEAKVICLEPNRAFSLDEASHNPAWHGGPESLAYLMYTSGSTGGPKGTLVPHRGLINYLTWCLDAYPVAAGSGAPVHSSIAFDLTVTSLFLPLLAGGTVHLLPQGNAIDLLRTAFRSDLKFSLVKITPAHLELLGQVLEPQEAAGRTRAFIIGGENLTARHIAFWQEHAPETLLVNEYGPTETVVGCCVYFLPSGRAAPGSVPIGRAIANTTLYVLDADMRPVEPGAPGELFIGGVGVARGYLNRPQLTAECFVPDPFGAAPGARLYRTGDIVRTLRDGNLEFLGRADGQVKLHGFRIETGEVEGVLHDHPAVRRAIVQVREDVAGETRLVAYVVPHPGRSMSAVDMRAYLRDRLPAFMVPADLVTLGEWPLTANGKVDVLALPAPVRSAVHGSSPELPIADHLTARLIELWEEVLGIRPVGARDNFFDLGGDSLQAVRIFTRIRKEWGCDLPLSTLILAPDIERLVKLLGNSQRRGVVSLVRLGDGKKNPPFFLVPGAGADVFQIDELARHLEPGHACYGLQPDATPEPATLAASLAELAACYLGVIRSVQPAGPYFLCGYSFGGTLAFEMARQLITSGETVAFLGIIDHHACPAAPGGRLTTSWRQILLNLPGWLCRDLGPNLIPKLIGRLTTLTTAEPIRGPAIHGAVTDWLFDWHVGLQAAYSPRPVSVRATLLRAATQKYRPVAESFALGRDLGWGRLAQQGVDVEFVSGWHDTIMKKPRVVRLAQRLTHYLDRARAANLHVPAVPQGVPEPPTPRLPDVPVEPASEGPTAYQVVANHEGQYSLMRVGRPCPAGWHSAGPSGGHAECLAYIQGVWTDLCPLSARVEPVLHGDACKPAVFADNVFTASSPASP